MVGLVTGAGCGAVIFDYGATAIGGSGIIGGGDGCFDGGILWWFTLGWHF